MPKPFVYVYSLCLLLILSTCGNKNDSDTVTTSKIDFRIIDKGRKVFPLDSTTGLDYNSRFKINRFDGKEYLSFGNRPLSMLYEFDYETGEPTRKIKLEQQGPNKVFLFFDIGYFFHDKDSIFIDSGGFGYFLVNGQGEVLERISANDTNRMDSDCCPIAFNKGTFYKDGRIYGKHRSIIEEEDEIARYVYGSIELKTGNQTKRVLRKSSFLPNHEAIFQMETASEPIVDELEVPSYYRNDLLYAASPFSDTVHVFRDFELIDKHYVGSTNLETTDFESYLLIRQRVKEENYYQNVTQTVQPPHYTHVFVSEDGSKIYRVFIETTKAIKPENARREIPKVSKAHLVVKDIITNQISTLELPVDEIKLGYIGTDRSCFVHDNGLHILTKEQENEDELVFRIFGLAN